MTGFAMAGLVLMVALLALVWKKRTSSWSRGEAGAELQEQGHLGQELQEMDEDRQSRGDNVQGLAGRIEPGGGVEQGRGSRCIGESNLQGRESEGQGLKKVIGGDAALI